MKRIGYVRTSTNKQYTDRQVHELKGRCDKVFIEDGVSARRKNRPVYRQVISELQDGDELIVMSYDRAYRSVVEGLNSLDQLTKRGVKLTSLTQSLDPTTPDGRLFFTMTIAVGEWEVNINSRRTVNGLKAALKRGARLGRPPKSTKKPAEAESQP